MKRTMKRHVESLGQIFYEGVLTDDESVSTAAAALASRIHGEASKSPPPRSLVWTDRPHVRPAASASSLVAGYTSPVPGSTSPVAATASIRKEISSIETRPIRSDPKTVISSAFKRNICGRVDLFYYNDAFMSRCLEDLQEVYQVIEAPIISSIGDIRTSDNSTWWRHLVSGAVAGAVSRTSTAPLDRLKVFLMVYSSRANDLRMSSAFQGMLKEGGIQSLWRGNGMNVAKVMPEMALKFMAYEQIKSYIKGSSNKELNVGERFAAGSLAGVLSQSAIYPLEVIKTRLVIRKTGQYSGVCDCAKNILKVHGLQGFYRGYLPNILGIIPYAGIDLAVYETLKRSYISHQSSDTNPGAEVLIACAIISSTCGQLVSYPLSLIRTRLQAHAVTIEGMAESVTGIVKAIAKTDGARGFYRGLLANMMKVAPAVSISYVVYEKTRLVFGADMS